MLHKWHVLSTVTAFNKLECSAEQQCLFQTKSRGIVKKTLEYYFKTGNAILLYITVIENHYQDLYHSSALFLFGKALEKHLIYAYSIRKGGLVKEKWMTMNWKRNKNLDMADKNEIKKMCVYLYNTLKPSWVHSTLCITYKDKSGICWSLRVHWWRASKSCWTNHKQFKILSLWLNFSSVAWSLKSQVVSLVLLHNVSNLEISTPCQIPK